MLEAISGITVSIMSFGLIFSFYLGYKLNNLEKG
jgi:hypothetical protein